MMSTHFIISDRQTGKTTKLINKAIANNGILIEPTVMMAKEVGDYCIKNDLDVIVTPYLNYYYLVKRRADCRERPVYIDDFGMALFRNVNTCLNRLDYSLAGATIDHSSIKAINERLSRLNVTDINGNKLTLKLDILKEGEK